MDDRYGPKRSENYRTKRLAASGRTETVELTRSELDRRAQLDQERSVAAAAMMITLGRSRLMRTFQSPLSCMLILTLALAAATVAGQGAPSPKAVPLFDSKTLDGWEGNLKIFRVEDGAIVAGTLDNEIARNEFLCTTRTFGDFELRLKVKLLGGDQANAGIQFRSKRIPWNHEVIGYQADMAVGYWGALWDESRRNKVLGGPDQAKMKAVVKANDWNDYVIRAEGRRIQLWINGFHTVDYTETDPAIDATGVIAVQIHAGPPSQALYKDITIVELTK